MENREKAKKKIKYTNQDNLNKPCIKVYKSNVATYALVLDINKRVLKSFDSRGFKGNKIEGAQDVGKRAGEFALKSNLKDIFFDRNGYTYQGRIKAVAEGARESGVKF